MRMFAMTAVLGLLAPGCATTAAVQMKLADIESGPDYVIVRVKGKKPMVYDCLSAPEGEHDPVCVRVVFRNNARAAERRADRRSEKMDDGDEE